MKDRMKTIVRTAVLSTTAFVVVAASTTGALHAREWQAWVGAEGPNPRGQALAFLPNELWIHTNDSVRWIIASTEIHTVTFLTATQPKLALFSTFLVQNGCGLPTPITPDGSSFDGSACVNADPRPPSPPPVVTTDSDGALHAIISSPADSANSGLLYPSSEDRRNIPQAPLGVTRFRVTFKSPGTYNYICALHDNLGMKGTVIVH
jgi:plastocyanin